MKKNKKIDILVFSSQPSELKYLFIFSQKYQNIDKYAKKFFDILVQTALTVGLIWTILESTPKSALLSFTILYSNSCNNEDLNLGCLDLPWTGLEQICF